MLSAIKTLSCITNHAKNLHFGSVIAFHIGMAEYKTVTPYH
jgi:hypothetical protein